MLMVVESLFMASKTAFGTNVGLSWTQAEREEKRRGKRESEGVVRTPDTVSTYTTA
jgi:hypothetical protein